MDIKQPFSLPDIRKYPREVLIAVLIGLLIYFIDRADNISTENARLNARIDTINTERIRLYDKIYFQQRQIEQQQQEKKATDSLLRKQTEAQVKQILQQ